MTITFAKSNGKLRASHADQHQVCISRVESEIIPAVCPFRNNGEIAETARRRKRNDADEGSWRRRLDSSTLVIALASLFNLRMSKAR